MFYFYFDVKQKKRFKEDGRIYYDIAKHMPFLLSLLLSVDDISVLVVGSFIYLRYGTAWIAL